MIMANASSLMSQRRPGGGLSEASEHVAGLVQQVPITHTSHLLASRVPRKYKMQPTLRCHGLLPLLDCAI